MPRANRHHLPGYVWHITHRCHRKEFLFKFVKDRKRWLAWLLKAKKRFGLRILNYVVTSNHIHLLVLDHGHGEISKSMQLVAGRTAQEYNRRKKRHGAFWEDRYHATAIESGKHLIRCMIYIDLNMVRAGAVRHPCEWPFSGYQEIHNPPKRGGLLDRASLMKLCNEKEEGPLKNLLKEFMEETLAQNKMEREAKWTDSVAIGDRSFVEETKEKLGIKAKGRKIIGKNGEFMIRETQQPYEAIFDPKKLHLNSENTYYWNDKFIETES